MKEVFKALLWGITVLTSVLYVFFVLAVLFYTVNENCWLSTSKINEVYTRVLPIIEALRTQYPGEENKKTLLGVEYHREADAANREIDRVTRVICPGASYYRSESFDELYSPKDKLELIAQYQKEPSQVAEYNAYSAIRFVCLFLMLIVGFYLLYRLAKFRRFSIQSNTYFLLSAAPIILTFTSLGLIYSDLSLSAHNVDKAAVCIGISIVWIFVVYPALYVLAKKRGGLRQIMFPMNLIDNELKKDMS